MPLSHRSDPSDNLRMIRKYTAQLIFQCSILLAGARLCTSEVWTCVNVGGRNITHL